MTGKAELMRLMHAARQEVLRRRTFGLPCLCAKSKVTRAEAMYDTILRREEEAAAQAAWTAHIAKVARFLNTGEVE